MKNSLAKMVIFSLIVMVAASMTVKAVPVPPSFGDDATATVNVHIPLVIDPIVPSSNGNILPSIVYKTGTPQNVYDSDSDPNYPAKPFAIFGINGTQNAPVILTYIASFLNSAGLTCTGQWVQRTTIGSTTTSTNLSGGILSLGTVNTELNGTSPAVNPIYNNSGGTSLCAYVYTIIAEDSENTATGNNQLIFTITAAYNF